MNSENCCTFTFQGPSSTCTFLSWATNLKKYFVIMVTAGSKCSIKLCSYYSCLALINFLSVIAPKYCLHSPTPFSFEMAPIKFALFFPSFLPFGTQSTSSPSYFFSPFPGFKVLWLGLVDRF